MKRSWLWTGGIVLVLAFLTLPSLGIGGGQLLGLLFLLLCPLMHFLGGHQHGSGGHRHASGGEARSPESPTTALREIKAPGRDEA